MTKTNCKADVTIENVEKLAKLIVSKYSVSMDEARELAEFNLNYAPDYATAAARV